MAPSVVGRVVNRLGQAEKEMNRSLLESLKEFFATVVYDGEEPTEETIVAGEDPEDELGDDVVEKSQPTIAFLLERVKNASVDDITWTQFKENFVTLAKEGYIEFHDISPEGSLGVAVRKMDITRKGLQYLLSLSIESTYSRLG